MAWKFSGHGAMLPTLTPSTHLRLKALGSLRLKVWDWHCPLWVPNPQPEPWEQALGSSQRSLPGMGHCSPSNPAFSAPSLSSNRDAQVGFSNATSTVHLKITGGNKSIAKSTPWHRWSVWLGEAQPISWPWAAGHQVLLAVCGSISARAGAILRQSSPLKTAWTPCSDSFVTPPHSHVVFLIQFLPSQQRRGGSELGGG